MKTLKKVIDELLEDLLMFLFKFVFGACLGVIVAIVIMILTAEMVEKTAFDRIWDAKWAFLMYAAMGGVVIPLIWRHRDKK